MVWKVGEQIKVISETKLYRDKNFKIGNTYIITYIDEDHVKITNSTNDIFKYWYHIEHFENLSVKRNEVIDDILK